MPLIVDMLSGVAWDEGKPDRLCHWQYCPLINYQDIKMRVCGQCTCVRYCSKECQRQDWPTHKRVCRAPQTLDLQAWIQSYGWLFKWAATEALQVHTDPSIMLNDCLVIDVVRGDRIIGPFASPFQLLHARVESIAEATDGASGGKSPGQALVVFRYHPYDSGGNVICHTERYVVQDSPMSGHQHLAQWEGVLKGVANGTIAVTELSRMVGFGGSSEVGLEALLENMRL